MDTAMKIVIAEDDGILAEEIRQFLVKWGYQAVVAVQFDDLAAACLYWISTCLFTTGFTGAAGSESGHRCRLFLSAAAAAIWTRLWRLPRAETTMWKNRFGWRY